MQAHELDRLDVLVVDDNDVNRMLVRRQLEKLDVRATCVEDPEEALGLFAGQSFDIVLLDCRMPRMDGFELARHMRAIEAERSSARTPIVALTAQTEPRLRDRVDAAGMDDLLHKPASLGDLRGVLVRWAGRPGTGEYPLDLSWIDRLLEDIGNPGAVRALLETYLRQLPLRTAGLRAAVRRRDVEAVSALGQELRAAGEAIGVVALSRLCQELENTPAAGLTGGTLGRIDEKADATEAALRRVLTGDGVSALAPR